MIKLIVGLGNPGKDYQKTRHNIGQKILEEGKWTRELNWRVKFKGLFASRELSNQICYYLIPTTYMNLSGESVLALASFYKIELSEILVLHDELDIPFGTVALKKGGGNAGHNGLKSITQCFSSSDFMRIRIGISRPTGNQEVADYVLSNFNQDEEARLEDLMKFVEKILDCCFENGFDRASNLYSKKTIFN